MNVVSRIAYAMSDQRLEDELRQENAACAKDKQRRRLTEPAVDTTDNAEEATA